MTPLPYRPTIVRDDLVLEHAHGMLDKMVEFVHEGRMEKDFRWLGFVQGCLWATRIHTIGQLANHNRRPQPPARDEGDDIPF